MNPKDVLLLGLKHKVTAVSRAHGTQLWSTELSSAMGYDFVTLLCDGEKVFAYSGGHLHCLELTTGRLLWRNELRGFGYGLASLSLSEGGSAPDLAAVQAMMSSNVAASSAAPTPVIAST